MTWRLVFDLSFLGMGAVQPRACTGWSRVAPGHWQSSTRLRPGYGSAFFWALLFYAGGVLRGFTYRPRTGENDHRAIYHRTLSRSELVDSGEDREVVARAAAELQQDTRGPPEPGCDRADEFRGIAGPEPESRAPVSYTHLTLPTKA